MRILFLFLCRGNRFLDTTRSADSDGEGGDILGDNRPGSNCRALANSHPRKNNHIASDPAIVLDEDWMAELHALAARKDAGIMTSSDDANTGANLHTVADDN